MEALQYFIVNFVLLYVIVFFFFYREEDEGVIEEVLANNYHWKLTRALDRYILFNFVHVSIMY